MDWERFRCNIDCSKDPDKCIRWVKKGLGHVNHLTEEGSWRNFEQLNFVYILRVDVCERENIRFCSELSFRRWLQSQPKGDEGGRGSRRERGKGKTPISMFVALLRSVNPLNPKIKFEFSLFTPIFISSRSSGEKLLKYTSSKFILCMSISRILMSCLFYKALILQGEIWCWSLSGLKGLSLILVSLRMLTMKCLYF